MREETKNYIISAVLAAIMLALMVMVMALNCGCHSKGQEVQNVDVPVAPCDGKAACVEEREPEIDLFDRLTEEMKKEESQ